MITTHDLLVSFGTIISFLLVALVTVVWYWAQRVDSKIERVETAQEKNTLEIELIKQNCRNRRKEDTGLNQCTI